MRPPRFVGVLLVAAAALASGCGDSVLTGPSAVAGGVWKLRTIETNGGGFATVSRPDNYTLDFQDPARLAVRADCNVCTGGYALSGASAQIGPLACTRAFCGSSSSDGLFLELLGSATNLGVRGLELRIDSPKGTLRLTR